MPESIGKRGVKVAISGAVAIYDQASRLWRRGVQARFNGLILLYHEVLPQHEDAYERQLRYLVDRYSVVSLNQMATHPTGRWPIAITFDDALASFHDVALPACRRVNVPVALFVPPGLLDTPGYMTTAALAAAASFENVQVGSHSFNHRRLSTLTATELDEELVASRDTLSSLIGSDVRLIAYPFGDWDDRVASRAEHAGYERAYTVRPSCVTRAIPALSIPRVTVEPTDWNIEFRLKVAGAYRWMGSLMALRRRFRGAAV